MRDTELSLRSLVSVDKLHYSRKRRKGDRAGIGYSPFFYAKKSDGADNNLRRLRNENIYNGSDTKIRNDETEY